MKKIDKFGLQLAAAFTFGILIILTGWALSANVQAKPLWASKPVQCSTPYEVDALMKYRNQEPLLGAVANVTFDDTQAPLPVVLWYGEGDNNFHLVEYNFGANQACIISIGDNVEFDVEDLVKNRQKELWQ